MYNFDAKKTKEDLVLWIRNWFEDNGADCTAVIGISGGKDSSVVSALCVEALGKDRVVGVLMPQGEQSDIGFSRNLVEFLDIKSYEVNIGEAYNDVLFQMITKTDIHVSEQTRVNLPPRLRMSMLYAVAQSINGRVIGTGNLSENYVGFFTLFGDGASSCEPIGNLTVAEVKAIGYELGLPKQLIEKPPTDGLGDGSTDEKKLGFTYEVLDKYLREGVIEDVVIQEKIENMHQNCQFKFTPMPMYKSDFMD
jgi:NAD+ synthase